jgi:hypothetical protein
MKITIEKIDISNLPYDKFINEYLLPEKPVIITGLKDYDKEKITPQYVSSQFQNDDNRSIGWYDAPMPSPQDDIYVPELIQKLFARDDMSARALPMRIFLQPQGHQTLFHYDGNSLHVFNLQIRGKKIWRIISPNTPVTPVPFLIASLVPKNFEIDYDKYDACEFELLEGEMLFLPRYWIHDVKAVDEVNINYNWVLTPTYPSKDSIIAKREVELLKLRKMIPLIDSLMVDNYGDYGGAGEKLVDKYIKDVSTTRVITRFFKEIVNFPKALLLSKEIKSMAADFEKNNFNVKGI